MRGIEASTPSLPGRVGLLLLLALPLLFIGLGNHGFWLTDEPFVAEVAREMHSSGDWIVPRLNGEPFLEKPPLHYLMVGGLYRLLGVTPLAARLPSATLLLLTTVAIYFLGRRLLPEPTAFAGALLFPTVQLVFRTARFCLVDPSLTLFVTLAFLAAAHAFGRDRRAWGVSATWVFAALAFLAKGPVGPAVIVSGLLPFAIARGRWRGASLREHAGGAALFAAVVGPWLAGLWSAGGGTFFREAFLANTWGRFSGGAGLAPAHDLPGAHDAPMWDYCWNLPVSFFPWTPLVILTVAAAANRWLRRVPPPGDERPGATEFLWSAFGGAFVLLSLSASKRGIYLLPLYPIFCLLLAREALAAADAASRRRGFERWVLGAQGATTTVLSVAASVAPFLLSGPWYGRDGDLLAAGSSYLGGSCAVLTALAAFHVFRRRRHREFLRVVWVQVAISLISIAAVAAPLLDAEKSFEPFFRRAMAVERSAGRLPLLFCEDETVMGSAGLFFGRPLDRLRLGGADTPAGSRPVDVITDDAGLARMRAVPGRAAAVLVDHVLPGTGHRRGLYLVRLEGVSASRPAAWPGAGRIVLR